MSGMGNPSRNVPVSQAVRDVSALSNGESGSYPPCPGNPHQKPVSTPKQARNAVLLTGLWNVSRETSQEMPANAGEVPADKNLAGKISQPPINACSNQKSQQDITSTKTPATQIFSGGEPMGGACCGSSATLRPRAPGAPSSWRRPRGYQQSGQQPVGGPLIRRRPLKSLRKSVLSRATPDCAHDLGRPWEDRCRACYVAPHPPPGRGRELDAFLLNNQVTAELARVCGRLPDRATADRL